MGDIAVRVEGLSKRYRLGQREPYKKLRDVLARMVAAPFRRHRATVHPHMPQGPLSSDETFWALKDVSFEIGHGEALGIIGRNGSGKSSLLKVLAGITEPTEGRVEIYGRMGSLLEVGTGFHPELTGRENIYLNGAIIGMKRKEIDRKFDEIVSFSGVGKFLDTPVKYYSSGMYVRLAFAVAAHLEPEILLVDEVLAVGDAEFQRKCLGKMDDIAGHGRTVLFISHNMSAVKSLCRRAIWLEGGMVKADGKTDAVVSAYLALIDKTIHDEIGDGIGPETAQRAVGTGEAILQQVVLKDHEGRSIRQIFSGENLHISAVYDVKAPIADASVEIGISTLDGLRMATAYSVEGGQSLLRLERGLWEIAVEIEVSLLPGQYALDLFLHDVARPLTIHWRERALTFTVITAAEISSTQRYPLTPERGFPTRGFIRPKALWKAPVPASL